jgi:hypothetical protein
LAGATDRIQIRFLNAITKAHIVTKIWARAAIAVASI